ncbi:hypothetical protein IV203_012146 [Nitzschia inconspicua]|uniref:Uncharacterized protein n=1 Tax=Nitzschia inconspicua TaxID=303405 RepID=A0A9K3KT61_9STRA|nr:hypothetical protein IV203_012146 [Nitzschia inconspicua]
MAPVTMNSTNDDFSDDSDEWGTEELAIPYTNKEPSPKGNEDGDDNGEDDEWAVKLAPATTEQTESSSGEPDKPHSQFECHPMIIVDITHIDANIHSKFDRNSVNDSAAASAVRKKIETNYEKYAKDANLIAEGTVIPCGSTVWRGTLMRLRDERPGHFFAPIFPPKAKS